MPTKSQLNTGRYTRVNQAMSKLSKEEIAARRKRMQEEALKSVAKTEQLNIRIDENSIQDLYSIAALQGKPVGTMVREWIIERLKSEQQATRQDQMKTLIDMVSLLHSRFDKLDARFLGEEVEHAGQRASASLEESVAQEYLRLVS